MEQLNLFDEIINATQFDRNKAVYKRYLEGCARSTYVRVLVPSNVLTILEQNCRYDYLDKTFMEYASGYYCAKGMMNWVGCMDEVKQARDAGESILIAIDENDDFEPSLVLEYVVKEQEKDRSIS